MKNVVNSSKIFVPEPTIFISTDASDEGWGVQLSDFHHSGKWTDDQLRWHINRKELFTIYIALVEFQDILKDQSVMIQSDNRTVVSYLRNQGGTRSVLLMEMTRKILLFAKVHDITVQSYYLPGRYNSVADSLSRNKVLPDWHLKEEVTRKIFLRWGTPQIDLFATSQSRVVPVYVSLEARDPQAHYINAFSRISDYHLAWVFPPPPLIPRILHHLNRASGIYLVVAPRWESVFWRNDLKRRAVEAPYQIFNLSNNLVDLSTNQPPPKVAELFLEVWKIRGGAGW